MTEQKAHQYSFSIYPDDLIDIKAVAAVTNSRNISAALRQIIQEWRTIRQMYYEGQLRRQQAAVSITEMTQEVNNATGTGNSGLTTAVSRDLPDAAGDSAATARTGAG